MRKGDSEAGLKYRFGWLTSCAAAAVFRFRMWS